MKTNRLKLSREVIVIFCDTHRKEVNKIFGKGADFMNVAELMKYIYC
jgi:hypothetical protein